MPCPKCRSSAVRLAEPGFARNTLVCMKCGAAFARTSPMLTATGVHALAFALPTLLIAMFHGDDLGDCS